jgi:hypothetical protein
MLLQESPSQFQHFIQQKLEFCSVLGFTPIFIIDKSLSRTRLFVYLVPVLRLRLRFNERDSLSRPGLVRLLSIKQSQSRTRPFINFQEVSFSTSQSRLKILVLQISDPHYHSTTLPTSLLTTNPNTHPKFHRTTHLTQPVITIEHHTLTI